MKYIPNIITVIRILLSIGLFFLVPFTSSFNVIYLIAGCSDILDGYIARKINAISKLGSRLDSVADFIMILVVFLKLLPMIKLPNGVYFWLISIVIIRLSSLMIVFYKFHTFAMLHTYANKAVGLLLFFSPLLYQLVDIMTISIILCIPATISAIEEMVIHITSKEIIEDTKGLLFTK